jgi:integrase
VVRVHLKGVNVVSKRLADGSTATYYYRRDTGTRLHGEPGSPQFLADIAKAEALIRDRHAGMFNALVRDYTASPEFEKLAASTRAEAKRMLTKAEVQFGTMPIAALDDPRVKREFMDWRGKISKSSGDREADNRLSAISSMLTWTVENGRLNANHLKGFRHLYRSSRADKIWLPENIEAFMAAAYVELQQVQIAALHTGQRQGDLLRMGWNNYDGTAITIRQGKPGTVVTIPCTKALKRMLDGMERKAAVILTSKSGRPWKADYFRHEWIKTAAKANVGDLHFHDLRGTAITMLAEAGCTPPEIAAITGHSFKTVSVILEKYLARTRALADQAIFRFENAKATRFANRLQTGRQKPKRRGGK